MCIVIALHPRNETRQEGIWRQSRSLPTGFIRMKALYKIKFNFGPNELLSGSTTIDVQLLTNRRSLIPYLFGFKIAQQWNVGGPAFVRCCPLAFRSLGNTPPPPPPHFLWNISSMSCQASRVRRQIECGLVLFIFRLETTWTCVGTYLWVGSREW